MYYTYMLYTVKQKGQVEVLMGSLPPGKVQVVRNQSWSLGQILSHQSDEILWLMVSHTEGGK